MTYELRHPILSRITAAIALAALLAGIPAVLLIFFWPVDLPTLDDLASPGEPQVIKVLLLLIVWTCWALFAWAVLVELVGTVRARHSRVRMPFQRLAAYLITTITFAATTPIAASRGMIPVTTVAATTVIPPEQASAGAEPEAMTPAQAYQTYVVKPRDTLWEIAKRHLGDPARYREIVVLNQGRVMSDGQTFSRGDWLRPGWTLRLPADAAGPDAEHESLVHGQVHVVRSGETLWEIADEHLGDGSRCKEIYELNKGRRQPGGGRLTDPDVLEPGWRLLLPEHPPATKTTPSTTLAPSPTAPESPPSRTPAPSRPATAPASPPASDPVSAQAPAAVAAPSTAVRLPDGGIVALSFATGVAVALASSRLRQRRRLPIPDVNEPVSVLKPEPQSPAVQALEQAHRRQYTESDEDPPDDFDLVTSFFAITPPIGVTVGTRDGDPVSLQLSGLNLGLTGPGAVAVMRAVVLDLLAQASQHRVEIVVSRDDATSWFGDSIHTLAAHLPGLRLVPGLDDAIDHLEGQFVTRRRILRDSGADDIPELRDTDPGEPLPALLLAAGSPDDGNTYLDTLMNLAPRLGMGALLIGRSGSGTTCEIDADSQTTDASGALADHLRGAQLFHMTEEAACAVLRKLAEGNGLPAEPSATEAILAVPPPGPAERPVRVGLLGEPAIEVNGVTLDISGRTKALELFVLLALHPKGLDKEEICAHLWPDVEDSLAGYRFHAALKDLRAALRDSTGLQGKQANFVEVSGKTYRIDAKRVDVDLWTYHRALAAARAANDEPSKVVALEAVAGLCRGVLAKGLKYDWLDQDHRWPLTIASIKALLQLGTLHEHAERSERALEIYDQACALDPDMESATTAAVRLLLKLGQTDEARLRVRQLQARLNALGVAASPETQAIFDQVNRRP